MFDNIKDETFAELFGDLFATKPKPKAPSDEAFDLARKWSQLAARFANIIAARESK